MADLTMDVDVVFATPDSQLCISVKQAEGSTIEQVVNDSRIIKQYPQIDLAVMKVGIFGKVCQLTKVVVQGDRVEIYRPLKQHPMEARRNRASK